MHMTNNPLEIRYFDIGSPVFIEKRQASGARAAFFFLCALAFAIGTNVLFESLCPNGGTMLTSSGLMCAL